MEPDAPTARDAAREELTDPAYQAYEPSLFERVSRAVVDLLQDAFDSTAGATPGGWWSIVVLALVLLLVLIALRTRLGPMAASGRRSGAIFTEADRSAADHHRDADAALAAGDLDAAVRERFRALVRGVEERGLLDPRPGRTADEAAAEAARLLAGTGAALHAAARIFGDVRYGGRAGTAAGHEAVAAADRAVRAARPAAEPASAAAGWAAPAGES